MTDTRIEAAAKEPADSFSKLLDYINSTVGSECKLPQPVASVYLSKAGNSIEVIIDNSKSTYSEWIKGEGADICLIRDEETHKVVGAHLPLYAKSLVIGGEVLPTMEFEVETGRHLSAPPPSPSSAGKGSEG